MLQGYKTWVGIAVMILGLSGLSKYVTPEQWQIFSNSLIDLIGLAITAYGNWDAHRRLRESDSE